MSAPTRQVLLLGLAGSGKSTFLMQFFGRLKAGRGVLRAHGAPRNLARIEAGLARLNQGLAVEHTPVGDEFTQVLPAQDMDGAPVEIALPDYSGEDLKAVVAGRRLPERWRELARSCDHWVVMIRLSQQARRPDVLNNPVGALAAKAWTDKEAEAELPLDMWAVELLQMLRYARAEIGGIDASPQLTLALSCWDEVDVVDDTSPPELTGERLALLDSYCRAHWQGRYRVLGLSALGQALDPKRSADEFVDRGPEQMGWIVREDGSRHADLTIIAA